MIDLDTVRDTHAGRRFDRVVALLLGLIAVLAALLGYVQMDASLRESRATAEAARLTAVLATGLPVRGVVDTFSAQAILTSAIEMLEGSTTQIVGMQSGDPSLVAQGVVRNTVGDRLSGIAVAMSVLPTEPGRLPAYESGLVSADTEVLLAQLAEQNRLVDVVIPDASTDSGRSVAGLSVLAFAGVLVGLSSVLGADRAGRATLLVAWLAAGVATLALLWSVLG